MGRITIVDFSAFGYKLGYELSPDQAENAPQARRRRRRLSRRQTADHPPRSDRDGTRQALFARRRD